jgi:Endomembrane protein 70
MDYRVDLTNAHIPTEVEYSYSVKWTKDNLEWYDRLSRYTNYSQWFDPAALQMHWIPLIVAVLFSLISIGSILRVLHNDFARYMVLHDAGESEEEEVRIPIGCLFFTP